ncbi:MAG: styrene monooxygenase/indole monooxygenase family protein [Rickettsiella sp.]|nr:styrene monooxygenase/indole monooxygenase family protein [Rickettsiella sp.]
MKNISIIGAGQAGLQLSIGLLKAGFNVSLYGRQNAKEVVNGNILSSPSLFHSSLEHERDLGLNYWETECPQNKTVSFTLSHPKKTKIALHWGSQTSYPYQAIDQRLKYSRWIEKFIQLGGHFITQDIKIKDLNHISLKENLTIVASGKSEISQLFPKNINLSIFDRPQRILCCLYVKGVCTVAGSQGVRVNVIPEVGEYFITPGLTLTGPCEMMLFEGFPGGPFDCWQHILEPAHRLEKALELLKKFIPWEAEHCLNINLTDNRATLQGCYTPIIRKPIITLSNKPILGIGDTVILNDPIGGQGANSAAKAAAFYLKKIKAHRGAFTKKWMTMSFETYWKQSAQWATRWTNLLLKPSQAFTNLLQTASHQAEIAHQLADAFDDPSTLIDNYKIKV